jgi:hypothetical protein
MIPSFATEETTRKGVVLNKYQYQVLRAFITISKTTFERPHMLMDVRHKTIVRTVRVKLIHTPPDYFLQQL